VTPGVDFFRVDRSRSTKRLLIVAAAMISFGALSLGAHLVHRLTPTQGNMISVGGGVVTLLGLIVGFGTMATMLFEDIYLAIRDDALLVHDNGKETAVKWDRLEGVDVDASRGLLTVRCAGEDPLAFHAGASASDVARRIEDAKRKAAHGLL
jgi:hypothetical protein